MTKKAYNGKFYTMKEKILKSLKENLPLIIAIGLIMFIYTRIGCPFRLFLGVCCPGCGMTRALMAVLCLDFRGALSYNPCVYILPIGIIIFLFRRKIPKTTFNALMGIGISLFIGAFIFRLVTGNEYVYIDPQRGLLFQFLKDLLEKIK